MRPRKPRVFSFSGGRTSGLMLWEALRLLDMRGPDDHVLFCNTGKEHEKTLEYVRETAERWNIKIVWLEYHRTRFPKYRDPESATRQQRICAAAGRTYLEPGPEPGFREVTFESASRRGEPFENLIDLSGLPNFNTPFCSTELKTRVIKKWMKARGYKRWDSYVGIRADEQWRVSRMRANAEKANEPWDIVTPLVDAGTTVRDVLDFWLGASWMPGQPFPERPPQGFDLGLQPEFGNCTLCYKKTAEKLVRVAASDLTALDWWEEQERRTSSVWNLNAGLVQIRRAAQRGVLPGLFDRQDGACQCTD